MNTSSVLRRLVGAGVSVALLGSTVAIVAPYSAAAATHKPAKAAVKGKSKGGKAHKKNSPTMTTATVEANGLALFDVESFGNIRNPSLGYPQNGVVIDNFQNGFAFLEVYSPPNTESREAKVQLKSIDSARERAVEAGDTGVTIDAPVADLALGDTVDKGSIYNSDDALGLLYGDGVGNFTPGRTGTLGFEYLLNGQTEYGYARIAISAAGNAATVIGGESADNGAAVSVAAVPEPATWLMMIAGVGLTGAALRVRRRGGAIAAWQT